MDRACSIRSISSSLVCADVHCFLGMSEMSMSARSTGIGSVGISALPMRVTTWRTSGKLSRNIFSASDADSTICESDVP